MSQHARRDPRDDLVRPDILGDDRPRPDERMRADGHATENHRAGADGSAAPYPRGSDLPVRLRLELPARGGAGIPIVDEADVVPHEALLLDGHALANKRVRADLATRANE